MQQRRLTSCREVAYDVALLLAQGLSYRKHAFDEAAAGRAVRAEADLSPEHAVAQGRSAALFVGPTSSSLRTKVHRAGSMACRLAQVLAVLRSPNSCP